MLARDLIDLMDANGSSYPYERVRATLADADITIANFEGTFTERGEAAAKFYTFRAPPRHAIGLAEAGIDVVSLGNNHAMDFGAVGLEDTLAALDAAGIAHSGAGMNEAEARRPAILDVNGVKIAFLSYNAVLEATFATAGSPGVARATLENIQTDVTAARGIADAVVVSIHAGTEYTDAPTEEQRSLARGAIEAGATLLIGHHPHVLQGSEVYGNGVILYSLGNFVFDLDSDDLASMGPRPFQTVIFTGSLLPEGIGGFSLVPMFIDPVEVRPRPPVGAEIEEHEERLDLVGGLIDFTRP
jgi:poly-gamma-glutamate synthesis protein (capsule biosynthesis protein)